MLAWHIFYPGHHSWSLYTVSSRDLELELQWKQCGELHSLPARKIQYRTRHDFSWILSTLSRRNLPPQIWGNWWFKLPNLQLPMNAIMDVITRLPIKDLSNFYWKHKYESLTSVFPTLLHTKKNYENSRATLSHALCKLKFSIPCAQTNRCGV